MRSLKLWAAGALWAGLAILMPMAALEPVAIAHAAEVETRVVALCSDGSANLAMGCESMHL
jgi:hypothetical protein